jgi:hypothetical protein
MNIKPFIRFCVLAALIAGVTGCAGQINTRQQQSYLQESRRITQEFVQKLGGTLKKELETSGAENAIKVCKEVAPALSKSYSTDGKVVKRVSLKVRNQKLGVPDAWEKEVLQVFERARNAGKPAAELEFSSVTTEEDGRWFRYMKALPTQPMCLQCHGKPADIQANVKNRLATEYPQDAAVGYGLGEIRGAVSIKHKL